MNYLFIDASENTTLSQIGYKEGFFTSIFETNRNIAALITEICDKMLAEAQIKQSQLDFFAVCTGPGSLTGLRVAASFMRAMAMLSDKPLVGVDVFTWSLQTLKDAGHAGAINLVLPTLIDKAFFVDACLPSTKFAGPNLVEKGSIRTGPATYAIRGQIAGINPVEPSAESLHRILSAFDPSQPFTFNDILEILPMYVIPSQAERKFEEKA